MRILMLTNSYIDRTRGGVELHVYNLAKQLIEAGHEVTVSRTSPGKSQQVADGPDLWVLDPESRASEGRSTASRGTAAFRFISNFMTRLSIGIHAGRILRSARLSDRFDVIHHHDFITSAVIARFLRRTGVRQVWTNHLGEFLILRRIPIVGAHLTRWLTKPFAAATGPSEELADRDAVSCSIIYVPNGVDVEVFRPVDHAERGRVRARLGLPENDFLCVVPRRWAPSKGVVFAARATSDELWGDVTVVLVGAGESDYPEYAAEVREALQKSRCEVFVVDSVDATGMADYLRASDVGVIPSLLEATSLSALEAMSSGLPLVASDVGGLPDLVSPATGVLVPPRSPGAIAAAVSGVRGMSPAERDQMATASRRFVVDSYSWPAIARRISVIYEGHSE